MRRLQLISVAVVAAMSLAPSPPQDDLESAGRGWTHISHNGDIRALYRVGDSLWVGTSGGLFVYDLGTDQFADHITLGTNKLPSNSVRAIAARGDSVYVGTDRGLVVFSHDTVSVFTAENAGVFEGAPFELIRNVDFGLDGLVYLSTYGFGLGVLDADTAWTITRDDSLLDDKVYGMVQEDDTTFYYATSMGLCAFRDSVWVNFQAGAGIPRAEIRQIGKAPDGGYYVVVGERGVYWFDGFRAKAITNRALFPEIAVAAFAVDAKGSLWACGRYGGIAVYRNGHWSRVDEDYPVVGAHRWRSAHADKDGAVYFGSADGLVLSIHDEVSTEIRLPAGLPSGSVESMMADSSGVLYMLNGSYLVRTDNQLGSIAVVDPSPTFVSMAVSPSGELWTATRWGVQRWEAGRRVEIDLNLSDRAPVVTAIGFDESGALWVGTQGGNVHRYDGEIWMRMADGNEQKTGAVREFEAYGGDGNLGANAGLSGSPGATGIGGVWVTGSRGGVARYDGARWTTFGPDAFGDRPARRVAISPNGTPVLATASGIWGYDQTGEWRPVSFVGGAQNDSTTWDPATPPILTIEFDPEGRLYVGTAGGLAVIDESGIKWLAAREDLGGETITSLFITIGNTLWVGFRSDGVTRASLETAR
jgi:ligand-binding sensor domain-containing protein